MKNSNYLSELNNKTIHELNTTSKHYDGSIYPSNELMYHLKTKTFCYSVSSMPNATKVQYSNGVIDYVCNNDLVIVDSYLAD